MAKQIKRIIFLIVVGLINHFAVDGQNQNFAVKGFHLDLRSEVMTMPALKAFAKELVDFKINTLVMEWEATFPYEKNATITNKYGYKPQEIKEFISYCSGLGIDVIPIHHCFGHAEWILRHDRYRYLSEDKKEISQICPSKIEEAKIVFRSLFKEMAAYHPSQYFHIGGDETYLLGSCDVCKLKVEKEGKSKLFVDYIKAMCEIVTEMGKIPVIWADIILKYPEAIKDMQKNVIYVDWNYGWKSNYFGNTQKLHDAGVTFWGSPALRSSPDNMYLTSWATHFKNQEDFIPYARANSYKGMVMTSWSTSGLYGFMYDQGWDIQDMEQVRNVYPLNGFRILLAEYSKAINQQTPIDSKEFVIEYAQSRFGFSNEEGASLWSVLNEPQEVVKNGKSASGIPVSKMVAHTKTISDELNKLKPVRNSKEFEHFKLMYDIRLNYLSFKEIESIYQSNNYNRSRAGEMLTSLNSVINVEKKLDKRFFALQHGFLTDREIAHLNIIRKRKMLVLRDNLKTQLEK